MLRALKPPDQGAVKEESLKPAVHNFQRAPWHCGVFETRRWCRRNLAAWSLAGKQGPLAMSIMEARPRLKASRLRHCSTSTSWGTSRAALQTSGGLCRNHFFGSQSVLSARDDVSAG